MKPVATSPVGFAAPHGWAPFELEPSEHTVPGGRSAGPARCADNATWTRFWNFSLGMESSAMLWLCRDEIKACGGHVIYADTGMQFPEAYDSLAQIEQLTGLQIDRVKQDYSFEDFLLERGGMLRQGYTDCSRRMKRVVLKRAHSQYPQPWEINLGYNADELQRAWDFSERNDVAGKIKWRFPLIEKNVDRAATVRVCEEAGFTIMLGMYRKMGRMDCYLCPNQKISQAQKVMRYYPALWADWKRLEAAKGHPFLAVPAVAIEKLALEQDFFDSLDAAKVQCSCFGGETPVFQDNVADARGGSAGERMSGPSELSGAQEPNEKLTRARDGASDEGSAS